MAKLLVKIESDDLAVEIQRRASDHGVSPDEEVRSLVQKALNQELRHPPKRLPAAPKKDYTLFDHFRKLGEIAPDFEFVFDRKSESPRPVDLE